MMPKVRISHPHTPPFTREALKALHNNNSLIDLVTTIAFREGSNFLLPKSIKRQLLKRAWLPSNVKVERRFTKEFLRLTLQKSSLDKVFGLDPQSLVDWVYRDLDLFTSKLDYSPINAVYCYEDGAASTFKEAKKHSVKCYYDLPIMYHKEARDVESKESQKYPELTTSLFTLKETISKISRKEEELQLADKIIVASELTKNSLLKHGFDQKKITVVPYGVERPQVPYAEKSSEGFNALFVGRVGPRKGVHHLLDSWKKLSLKDAKLTLVGINEFPKNELEKRLGHAEYKAAIPRSELSNLYQKADILILPSLVEGFGLVLLEALSYGVPFIASSNTAGPEILKNFECGWTVDPSSSESLSEKINFAYSNRKELKERSIAAKKAAEHYSWERYRSNLLKVFSGE